MFLSFTLNNQILLSNRQKQESFLLVRKIKRKFYIFLSGLHK